jgi:large subunit ribosomal protein L6
MSRIGKKPIAVPEKVEVKAELNKLQVKGPKGELSFKFAEGVKFLLKDKNLTVEVDKKVEKSGAIWGLSRSLAANMVTGVTLGFVKSLEFNGVGYKAAVQGDVMTFNLGHSHPIEYKLPKGVTAKVTKNLIEIQGCNKELVGFVAAKIRTFRPPEPYKGKGLKYIDEKIIMKAGKSGAKK